MPVTASLIGVGGSLIGGLFGASSARSAAKESAAAQLEAARIAADAAKFRPYSIKSGFGSSSFNTDDQTASYELDPTMKAFRDQLYGLSNQQMGQVNLDPTQAAQNYYNQQQGLMAGGRQAEDMALRQQQLQSGRIGLGLSGASQGAGAGTGYVNPQQYQMQLARGMTDQNLAAQSSQMAQADIDRSIGRATGLFTTGTGIEQLGQSALTMGADIGNKASVSQGQQAAALLAGGQGAANANLAAGLGQAGMWGNMSKGLMGQDFSGLFGSTSPASSGYNGQPNYQQYLQGYGGAE